MLLLLPLIFFALIAIVLGIFRWRGMRMAYLWLVPVIIALVCWLIFVILPIPSNGNVIRIPGLFSLFKGGGLSFNLAETSWGFIFLVITLVLVYFLTLLVRLEDEKRTALWIGWLSLSTAAILAFTAGNLTTLVVTWSFFDILDFIFTFLFFRTGNLRESLGNFLFSRVPSLGLLIISGIFLSSPGDQWLPAPLLPAAYFLLFLAALFRMNILHFRTENSDFEKNIFSFDLLKRMLLVLLGFSLLSLLPIQFLSDQSQIALMSLLSLLAVLLIFISLKRKISTRDLWLNVIICLGFMTTISGSTIALVGWAGVVMLGMGIPFFYSHRSKRYRMFGLLGILSLAGLPYSISGFALAGLTTSLSMIWLIPGLFIYSFLLYDHIRYIYTLEEEKETSETPYLALNLFGLFLFSLSPFTILIKNPILASNVLRFWWIGIVLTIFCLIYYWMEKKVRWKVTFIKRLDSLILNFNNIAIIQWLRDIWLWISWFVSGLVQFLTRLLEGEGGVLWAVVILVLLVSLISVGR